MLIADLSGPNIREYLNIYQNFAQGMSTECNFWKQNISSYLSVTLNRVCSWNDHMKISEASTGLDIALILTYLTYFVLSRRLFKIT